MPDNELILPQEIYLRYLETVDEIKFTSREIDVMSCLFSTRLTTKEVAFFLSMAPKTVGTHVTNIMGKMDCNSREGISKFIEKSGQFSFIKKHYQSLKILNCFKQHLRKVKLLAKQSSLLCEIVDWGDQQDLLNNKLQKAFISQLKEHLELANITVKQITKATDDIISFGKPEILKIYIASEALRERLQAKNFQENSFYFLLGEEQKNYYFVIFDILEKLLSDVPLDKIITAFKEQCALIHKSSDAEWPKIKDVIHQKHNFRSLWTEILKKKFVVSSILCLSIFLLFFLSMNNHKTNDHRLNTSIRSDLPLPTEGALLKRPDLIKQIEKKLSEKGDIQTVALVGIVGMGGVGKTTIARCFARSQNSNVVWEVNAETKESLINSFRDLAYALAQTKEQKEEIDFIQKIQKPEEKEKQIIAFVKHHLKEHGNWILIYDNVENFAETKSYFPQDSKAWGKGSVIITTRDSNIKSISHINPENVVQIDELSQAEALNLFSKILYGLDSEKLSQDQREKDANFLQQIPPFPLDISIAAYYIKNAQITYEQYLERVSQYSQPFEKVQKSLLKEATDYTRTRYGIITSSMEKLISINPNFKERLLFICLLDSQNIPKELLQLYEKRIDSSVDEFIHSLKKYSLITNESQTTFFLHRSTQNLGRTFLLSLFTVNDKKAVMDKIIDTVNIFYNIEKPINIILIINHLEALVSNLEKIGFLKSIKEQYKSSLLLLAGNIHMKYISNYIIVKKYLTHVYNSRINNYFPDIIIATLLNNLGEICAVLNNYDQSLFFCHESMKLCKKIPNSEILIAKNLTTMGFSHRYQDNFKEAKRCFEVALEKISSIDSELKREVEAEIYRNMGTLYSTTYINRKEAYEGEKYAVKALEILNASKLLSNTLNQKQEKISCYLAWCRGTLSTIYNRFGNYEDALIQSNETEYLMKNSFGDCSHDLLRSRVLANKGEILLRKNQFGNAEKLFTESIHMSRILIGEMDTAFPRIYRAETRVRLGKLTDAYKDCIAVFEIGPKIRNNYYNLTYLTCFYHAAIIKYKQDELAKSLEHFSDFFKAIKIFCQSFLDAKEFQDLEAKGAFAEITYDKSQIAKQIKQCLEHSVFIFTAIYGSNHPFVRDYVAKNSIAVFWVK